MVSPAGFGQPTYVQAQAWLAIQSGTDVLIAAPTGSGKTFAAFLSCIDHLFKQALRVNLTTTRRCSTLRH